MLFGKLQKKFEGGISYLPGPSPYTSAHLVVQRDPPAVVQVPPVRVEYPLRMGDKPRALQHDAAESIVAPRLAIVPSSSLRAIRGRTRAVQDQVDIAEDGGVKERRVRRAEEPPAALTTRPCVSFFLGAGVEKCLEGIEGAPRVSVYTVRVDGRGTGQGPGEQVANIPRQLPSTIATTGPHCGGGRLGGLRDLLPGDGAHAAQQGVADEPGAGGGVDVPAAQDGLVGGRQVQGVEPGGAQGPVEEGLVGLAAAGLGLQLGRGSLLGQRGRGQGAVLGGVGF